MASVGRGLRAIVVGLVATLLVFRVAERVTVTVESPGVVDTQFDGHQMYMWPCLCSHRPVVSPVASNSSHWLTVASLLLAGDVQPNPVPAPEWKNPCGIFFRAVHSNQKGICCDVCYELLHTKCIGMPYQRLSTSDEGWCRNRCHKMAFPFDDCLAISDSSTNDSLCLPSIYFQSRQDMFTSCR